MRIDSAAVPESRQPARTTGGRPDAKFIAGDEINGKILFNKDGVVHIKTNDGQIVKAQIEGDVSLPVGADALLTVVGERDDGTVVMTLGRQQAGEDAGIPPEARELPIPQDKLEAYANTLREMRLPVTGENLGRMHQILEQNPDMSLREAAFLAANRISAESGVLQAAKELLAGDAKTALMLQELVRLLGEAGLQAGEGGGGTDPLNQLMQGAEQGQAAQAGEPSPTWASWLQDLVKVFGGAGAEEEAATAGLPEEAVPAGEEQEGLQAGKAADSPNTSATREQVTVPRGEAGAAVLGAGEEAVLDMDEVSFQDRETAVTREPAEKPFDDQSVRQEGRQSQVSEAPRDSVQTQTAGTAEAQNSQQSRSLDSGMHRIVLSLLTQMPAFEGVSRENMQQLADMLLSTAGEFAALDGNPAELPDKLKMVLDRLFTKLNAGDEGQGEALRQAKDELFVRLSFFNEALASSDIAGKSVLMGQTQRILNHVKLMGDIDQFVCMQLPVTLNEEQKNADLYIYKQKKGGRKIDPDNVKILLALDLTHMGHMESFISIRGKDVSLEFEMETNRAVNLLRANTVKLHGYLAEAGFRLADSWVRKAEKDTGTTVSNALFQLFSREKRDLDGIDMQV